MKEYKGFKIPIDNLDIKEIMVRLCAVTYPRICKKIEDCDKCLFSIDNPKAVKAFKEYSKLK